MFYDGRKTTTAEKQIKYLILSMTTDGITVCLTWILVLNLDYNAISFNMTRNLIRDYIRIYFSFQSILKGWSFPESTHTTEEAGFDYEK